MNEVMVGMIMKPIMTKMMFLVSNPVVFKCPKGPIKPDKPNPALLLVPTKFKNGTEILAIIPLTNPGRIIIGLFIKLAICILGEPRKCANDVPSPFVEKLKIARLSATPVIPIFAAAEPPPTKLMATATATVEIGETINKPKNKANSTDITNGCMVVKRLTKSPISKVNLVE